MQSKRRWLPGWQRVELVALCLDRGTSRREAASYRRVSVSTVQYWIGRYGSASEAERATEWARTGAMRTAQRPPSVHEVGEAAGVHARELGHVDRALAGHGERVPAHLADDQRGAAQGGE